jgi:hypothetical protein
VPSPADAQFDEIYGAPLGEFISRRDALAKELKKAGDVAGAEALSKARRPTVVAWAVNQVVRGEPEALEELLDASAAMHQAQSALLSGGDPAAFRSGSDRLRAAVRKLTELAVKVAVDAGHGDSASVMGRIERTLFTSATGDEAARELLRRGRFVGDVAPADGLTLGGFEVATTPAPAPAPKAAKAAQAEKESKASAQARRKAELEVERLEALAGEIAKQATRATKRAEALDAAAREAETQAQVATARAVQARQEAAEAKVEALGLDAKARAVAQDAATARTRV